MQGKLINNILLENRLSRFQVQDGGDLTVRRFDGSMGADKQRHLLCISNIA
jgi:hypothetical protein